jgi:hypothetical protein
VINRIRGGERSPHGVMLHFCCTRGDDMFVGTAYRDRGAMDEMFSVFTAPALAREFSASETSADISRREYPLYRFLVAPDLAPGPFRFVGPDEMHMVFDSAVMLDPAIYDRGTAAMGFPELPPGMLIHLVVDFGEGLGIMDFWDNADSANRFYAGTVRPTAMQEGLEADVPSTLEESWLDVHSFQLAVGLEDPLRAYTRGAG